MYTAEDPQPALAAHGRDWQRAWRDVVCDEVRPCPHGSVGRSARYPDIWVCNAVRLEEDPGEDTATLLALADEVLADCAHRMVTFEIAINDRQREGLLAAGWRVTRLVWMHHQGVLPGSDDAITPEPVPYDAVQHLRLAWHLEDFDSSEVENFHAQAREVAMRAGARVLAVVRGGRPIGYAQVEAYGGAAEVGQVFVASEHRGGGLGTALTTAAIRAAAELAPEVWISADADGRPRRLYERLGFRSAWYAAEAVREPGKRA